VNRERGSRQSRGYTTEYDRNRREVVKRVLAAGGAVPCVLCGQGFPGSTRITVEHIVPLRDGGTNALANLGPAHECCNKGWRKQQDRQ
jgi:5-methylcytosine-specific restriction endonuclease McrA